MQTWAGNTTATFSLTNDQIQTLFSTAVSAVETQVDNWLSGIPQSSERIALVSLAYTSANLLGPALHAAIASGNRAAAWYEIRYDSNSDGDHAERRYTESDEFGLYDSGAITTSSALSVYQMYTSHRATINAYDLNNGGTESRIGDLQTARDYLTSTFGQGLTFDDAHIYAYAASAIFTAPANTSTDRYLDFLSGIATDQLWFAQSGNDLTVDLMGTNSQIDIANWFSNDHSKLSQFVTSDGSKLDSALNTLIQAMATFGADNPGFNPMASTNTTVPSDPTLESILAASWHS